VPLPDCGSGSRWAFDACRTPALLVPRTQPRCDPRFRSSLLVLSRYRPEQLWQPHDVDGDPPSLILREHVRVTRKAPLLRDFWPDTPAGVALGVTDWKVVGGEVAPSFRKTPHGLPWRAAGHPPGPRGVVRRGARPTAPLNPASRDARKIRAETAPAGKRRHHRYRADSSLCRPGARQPGEKSPRSLDRERREGGEGITVACETGGRRPWVRWPGPAGLSKMARLRQQTMSASGGSGHRGSERMGRF
jgi:hypothetical protein